MNKNHIDLVTQLNDELYDRFNETEHGFTYRGNGIVNIIEFDGLHLIYNEDGNDYDDNGEPIPLREWVLNKYREVVARMQRLDLLNDEEDGEK